MLLSYGGIPSTDGKKRQDMALNDASFVTISQNSITAMFAIGNMSYYVPKVLKSSTACVSYLLTSKSHFFN
jgi:hypothetical protein